ncbi:MAG: hypothetical protein Kow0080_01560 [Candidatus Promineifilaceae bacterium]
MPNNRSRVYAYPLFFHGLFAFSVVVGLFMLFVWFMAFRESGGMGTGWLIGGAVILTVVVYLLYMLVYAPRQVAFLDEQICVGYWGRRVCFAPDAVTAVRHTRGFITLYTPQQTIRLSKLIAGYDAQLWVVFTAKIPYLRQQKAAQYRLPFTINTKRLTPALLFGLGFMLLVAGGGSLNYFAAHWVNFSPVEHIISPLVMVLMVVIGLVMVYQIMWQHVWRIVVDEDRIVLYGLLRVRWYDPGQLTAVTRREQTVKVRGFPRTKYWLKLTFADGQALDLSPNETSFPMDYPEAEQLALLGQLETVLTRYFLEKD